MSFSEAIKRITHREYLTWLAYLEDEWNEPSRTDHYLMQIAQEIRMTKAKSPRQVKMSWFRLKFGKSETETQAVDPAKQEAQMNASKARWKGFLNRARQALGGRG